MVVAGAASPSPAPHAASPSPAPHAAAGRPHPTYTKMITHALADLGGCSERPAIAEYILGRFSGLPAAHDALLSAHLRRLVAEGVLRVHGESSSSYVFAPPPSAEEEKRGPGRPRKDSSTPAPVVGEKRGPGRPRKDTGTATPSLLPAKRKHPGWSGLSGHDDSVTKRGPGRPPTQEVGHEAEPRTFQNGGHATPVQSGGAPSTGVKRGRGRPRKEKPPSEAAMSPKSGKTALSSTGVKRRRGRPRKENQSPAAAMPPTNGSVDRSRGFKIGRERPRKDNPSPAAAMSPTAGSVAATSRGFKRGCGRPSIVRPPAATSFQAGGDDDDETSMEKLAAAAAAAMYAETGGDAAAASTGAEAGGGQLSMMLKLAAVAAMSGEGFKRGCGRPRKNPAIAAMSAESVKRGPGRPRKEKPATGPPQGKKRRGRPRKDQQQSQGKKRRGRPRKDQQQSTGAGLVEPAFEVLLRRGVTKEAAGARREEEKEEDLVSSGEKAQTEGAVAPGHWKENGAADARYVPVSGEDAAMSPESGKAAPSMGVKRGRGRPRKEKPPAPAGDVVSTGGKRGRGRPRKDQQSIGTGFVQAAGEVLFRDNMAEASRNLDEDLLSSGKKKQTEGVVAPGDRGEIRAADAGC